MEDNIRKKSIQILKQPAYRISNMLKQTPINVSSDNIRICLEDIRCFCKKIYKQNIVILFLIEYNNIGIESNFILENNVMAHIQSLSATNHYIHYLDINANLIESKLIYDIDFDLIRIDEHGISGSDIPIIADSFQSTFIYSYGMEFSIYHSGKCLEHSLFWGKPLVYGKIVSQMKPISRYKEIIMDHYHSYVRLSQGIDHWHNKKNRILRNSPEDIFKKSLWAHMDNFAEDAIEVTQEYQLPSESKIDILARTSRDDIYIFEIKVLGSYLAVSDKKDFYTYSEERVHEGLIQTKQYIEQLSHVNRGTVVVYDARDKQLDIHIPDDEKHIKLDEPLYLYLESDSATETAKKIRKQIKCNASS